MLAEVRSGASEGKRREPTVVGEEGRELCGSRLCVYPGQVLRALHRGGRGARPAKARCVNQLGLGTSRCLIS